MRRSIRFRRHTGTIPMTDVLMEFQQNRSRYTLIVKSLRKVAGTAGAEDVALQLMNRPPLIELNLDRGITYSQFGPTAQSESLHS